MSEADVVGRFFERLMELRPVEATYHGLHQHDHRLPEGGLAAAEEQQALVRSLEADLARERNGLDLDLARYYAALTRFQLEELRLWERMPEAPDQIGTGVFLLFARDFAPLQERLETITRRLEAVPAYLAATREQLRSPVRLWTEIAIESVRELPGLFAAVTEAAGDGALRGRLDAGASAASEAAEDFARWLEGDALPRASDGWALGEEGFGRLMELRELPDAPAAILALGRSYLAQVKEERTALLAEHWPGRSVEQVNEEIRSGHPESFEASLAEYRQVIAGAREFVRSSRIATLPPDEVLLVEPTPSFLRPVIPFAAYEPPARFDDRQLGIYVVTPRDGDLGEHNRAAVLNTSVHEAYPGHHLQFACANRHPSLARLLSADHATELIEGWAHYCEQLMYEQGFSGGPEVRFVQLNDLIWRACRIVIDVELSSGRMSFVQAVEMLVAEAAMTRAGAEAEVKRYTFTPGYQLSYLYGKHLIVKLRERRRRIEGASFDLCRFHDTLLYAGAVPAAVWDSLFE